jgi:hypothetical protein
VSGARTSCGQAPQRLPRSGLVQRGLFPPRTAAITTCTQPLNRLATKEEKNSWQPFVSCLRLFDRVSLPRSAPHSQQRGTRAGRQKGPLSLLRLVKYEIIGCKLSPVATPTQWHPPHCCATPGIGLESHPAARAWLCAHTPDPVAARRPPGLRFGRYFLISAKGPREGGDDCCNTGRYTQNLEGGERSPDHSEENPEDGRSPKTDVADKSVLILFFDARAWNI